jgi:hypothetical protein
MNITLASVRMGHVARERCGGSRPIRGETAMLEALVFALVVVALGLPGLIVALFGSTLTSDLPTDQRTAAGVKPKQIPRSAFEVMSPPLWFMRSD